MKLNKMVLDKKIEEAKEEIYEDRFLLNGEDVIFDNDAKEEMFVKEDIKEAIGLGAKWAINEFIKYGIQIQKSQIRARAILLPLVLKTMLIYSLKNPFFGMRNLGDIRLADAKSTSGLIYLIYCQSRKEVSNENISIRYYAQRKICLHIEV